MFCKNLSLKSKIKTECIFKQSPCSDSKKCRIYENGTAFSGYSFSSSTKCRTSSLCSQDASQLWHNTCLILREGITLWNLFYRNERSNRKRLLLVERNVEVNTSYYRLKLLEVYHYDSSVWFFRHFISTLRDVPRKLITREIVCQCSWRAENRCDKKFWNLNLSI